MFSVLYLELDTMKLNKKSKQAAITYFFSVELFLKITKRTAKEHYVFLGRKLSQSKCWSTIHLTLDEGWFMLDVGYHGGRQGCGNPPPNPRSNFFHFHAVFGANNRLAPLPKKFSICHWLCNNIYLQKITVYDCLDNNHHWPSRIINEDYPGKWRSSEVHTDPVFCYPKNSVQQDLSPAIDRKVSFSTFDLEMSNTIVNNTCVE